MKVFFFKFDIYNKSYTYRHNKDMKNVNAGKMLQKADDIEAEVRPSPSKAKYCVRLDLENSIIKRKLTLVFFFLRNMKIDVS